MAELTQQLGRWNDDDGQRACWPLVYNELRRMAGSLMKGERSNHTLQPTALVNEAYFKLATLKQVRFRDRSHFFAIAAQMMRRILVDYARAFGSKKRYGGERISLDAIALKSAAAEIDLLDLDDALNRLEEMDPDKALVVELRFFAGFTHQETASLLNCSERTVRRHWNVAKLWLHRELSGEPKHAT